MNSQKREKNNCREEGKVSKTPKKTLKDSAMRQKKYLQKVAPILTAVEEEFLFLLVLRSIKSNKKKLTIETNRRLTAVIGTTQQGQGEDILEIDFRRCCVCVYAQLSVL